MRYSLKMMAAGFVIGAGALSAGAAFGDDWVTPRPIGR
jgi:hypothetical protein